MVCLKITLLAGRYHATPWARHVNEGKVEWPPSPWRILRAVTSGCLDSGSKASDKVLQGLVDSLASCLPEYLLPDTSYAHVRLYQPNIDKEAKNKFVFDPFLVTSRHGSAIFVRWKDAELDTEQMDLLKQGISKLGYLGRAESWASWQLVDEMPGEPDCRPVSAAGETEDSDSTRLLAPSVPQDYEKEVLHLAEHASGKLKKMLKGCKSLVDSLMLRTSELQAAKLDRPPGTRWVMYSLPNLRFTEPPRPFSEKTFKLVRFAVVSKMPPPVTHSLWFGDAAHACFRYLADKYIAERKLEGPKARQLLECMSGRSAEGERLTGHLHAHFIPEDADRDEFLDHLILYAPAGIPAGFASWVQRYNGTGPRVYGWQEGAEALLSMVQCLEEPPLRPPSLPVTGESPLLGTSRTWLSETPFLAARHFKKNKGSMEAQLKQQIELEAATRGYKGEVRVTIIDGREPVSEENVHATRGFGALERIYGLSFKRFRRRGRGSPADSRPIKLLLGFDEPVTGPVVFGFGSHMGLGIFRRVE